MKSPEPASDASAVWFGRKSTQPAASRPPLSLAWAPTAQGLEVERASGHLAESRGISRNLAESRRISPYLADSPHLGPDRVKVEVERLVVAEIAEEDEGEDGVAYSRAVSRRLAEAASEEAEAEARRRRRAAG